jgi:hypothetical protein
MAAGYVARRKLSFVAFDVDDQRADRLSRNLERILTRQGFDEPRVKLERVKSSSGKDAMRFTPVIKLSPIIKREPPVNTPRPRERRPQRRRASSSVRRPRRGRDPDEPAPPLGRLYTFDSWGGILAASARLHAHVLRRAAAMRLA